MSDDLTKAELDEWAARCEAMAPEFEAAEAAFFVEYDRLVAAGEIDKEAELAEWQASLKRWNRG